MDTADEKFDAFLSLLDRWTDFADIYFLMFIQQRNLRSGANTMTRAGITSPNGGLLTNWPGWGPDGNETVRGDAHGDSNSP